MSSLSLFNVVKSKWQVTSQVSRRFQVTTGLLCEYSPLDSKITGSVCKHHTFVCRNTSFAMVYIHLICFGTRVTCLQPGHHVNHTRKFS